MIRLKPIPLALIALTLSLFIQLLSLVGGKTVRPQQFDGTIFSYSDSSKLLGENGRSTVSIDQSCNKGLRFSYRLDNQFHYYYSGVVFAFREPVDLTNYSHLKIRIATGNAATVRIFLLSEESPHSDRNNSNTWRHLQHMIISSPTKKGVSTLPLDQFYTPQWWFDQHGTSEPEVSHTPLKRVIGIKIESGEGEPVGVDNTITISGFRFYNPLPPVVRAVQAVLIAFALALLILRFGFIRRGELGKYTPVVMGSLFDEELQRITDDIGTYYPQANLSLTDVARRCSMHPDKVTALLRRGYGQTYKQYLNRLRLTEAQRLLRTTDRSVQEIASAVGYNSVSHFNRVFKEFFNSTPREFRS